MDQSRTINLETIITPHFIRATSNHTMIPLDIVGVIMELLAQDSDRGLASLRACSLACHTFLAFSRPHIFHDINLYSLKERLSFERLLDANPSIADHVRSIHYKRLADEDNDIDSVVSKAIYAREPRVLERLHRVSSLTLVFIPDGDWKTLSASLDYSLSSLIQSNSIFDLELSDIYDVPLSIFWYLPHLKILDITRLSFADIPLSDNFNHPKGSPKLVILKINDCTWNSIMGEHSLGVAPFLDLSGLEEFFFRDYESKDANDVHLFRHFMKPSQTLKSLNLIAPYGLDLGDLASSLSPGSLKTLKVVKLTANLLWGYEDPYLHFTKELEKIAGKNVLETLIINVLLMPDTIVEDPTPWSQLDLVLSQSCGFPFLRNVDLKISARDFFCNVSALQQSKFKGVGKENFTWLKNNKQLEFRFEVKSEI